MAAEKSKLAKCKWCDEGHEVKSDGSHWIVKSIIPARINIVKCKGQLEKPDGR